MKIDSDSIITAIPPFAGILGGVLKTYHTGSEDLGTPVFLGFFVGILTTVFCFVVPLLWLRKLSVRYTHRRDQFFDVVYYSAVVLSSVLAFVITYFLLPGY